MVGGLGDDILFRHAAHLVEGLAALRAAQLETTPSLLAVFDAGSAGHVGGTRDAVERWQAFGLPEGSQIRIGLNAGPVFRGHDPVIGRDNYYGASVTRAARIEPVTPPGTVFASEAFAATLAATGAQGFLLEYVGRVGLAKSYGEARVYRLDRR